MNVNLFAAKKTQTVTFKLNKAVRHVDLGIQRLVGPAKDKLIMKAVLCNNVLASA